MLCGFGGLWVVSVSLFFGLVITRVLWFVVICCFGCFGVWLDGLIVLMVF